MSPFESGFHVLRFGEEEVVEGAQSADPPN